MPLKSLKEGRWVKLICGASYQNLPAIRNLALVYSFAGVDCIDVAADIAVIRSVKDAFQAVRQLQHSRLPALASEAWGFDQPLLMVSFSDGEDPHFRKATFEAAACPPDCGRPCESICPASAILFDDQHQGVLEDRCYGCGRCLPVCPLQHIEAETRATSPAEIAPQILAAVDAIELHTQVGRYDAFMALWAVIRPYLPGLSVLSISCQDHEDAVDYLWRLYAAIQPLSIPVIWQTDGRSMSGDLGKGTTHATLRFAKKVLQSGPPGFVQLAGGTNDHTVTKLDPLYSAGTTQPCSTTARPATFGGIAYGSFARRLLQPFLEDGLAATSGLLAQGETFASTQNTQLTHHDHDAHRLETDPIRLIRAVRAAQGLVAPFKATGAPAVVLPSQAAATPASSSRPRSFYEPFFQ